MLGIAHIEVMTWSPTYSRELTEFLKIPVFTLLW
jgi:hypothetical protein